MDYNSSDLGSQYRFFVQWIRNRSPWHAIDILSARSYVLMHTPQSNVINIISARGRSIGSLYIIHFRHKNVDLGSGTIAIGFGSKFCADSRHPDPEIFVLRPFRAFVHHFPKIEIEMYIIQRTENPYTLYIYNMRQC
jgi:hypothetical protein